MEKIDFRREFKDLYAPSSKDFSIVDVPSMRFLMVDGQGDPNSAESYREAVEAVYAVSYVLKFASKKELDKDYVVAPLEGLWSAPDPSAFELRAKDEWQWTMLIMQPSWISAEMVDFAFGAAEAKKDLPALSLLRLEDFAEGQSAQILHIGSYDDEAPTLRRLHTEFMPAHGLTFNGRHHEIYLSDPRKTEAANLKTILRQPVKQIEG
jgi:hypothetical protein